MAGFKDIPALPGLSLPSLEKVRDDAAKECFRAMAAQFPVIRRGLAATRQSSTLSYAEIKAFAAAHG